MEGLHSFIYAPVLWPGDWGCVVCTRDGGNTFNFHHQKGRQRGHVRNSRGRCGRPSAFGAPGPWGCRSTDRGRGQGPVAGTGGATALPVCVQAGFVGLPALRALGFVPVARLRAALLSCQELFHKVLQRQRLRLGIRRWTLLPCIW